MIVGALAGHASLASAATACAADGGPPALTPATWANPAAAQAALARPGFARLAFTARDGNRLALHLYRPSRFDPQRAPLWFVMHGVNRDADRYVAIAAPAAERHQVLAVAIEFSRQHYPAGADYTLGVKAPRRARPDGPWRAPHEFTYNEVERVFELLRASLGGQQGGYHLFGHSAGAQFTHRLLTFVPCARVLTAVAANAGWYTLPTMNEGPGMPYGLRDAPPGAADVRALLRAPLHLLLGERDTAGPDDDDHLRGAAAAMAQGPHRLARGRHYFETGRQLARRLGVPFGWRLHLAPGAGHDARQVIASAAHLLFADAREAPCASSSAAQGRGVRLHEVLAGVPVGEAGDVNRDGARHPRDDQYVELVNTGAHPVCLAGWTLQRAGGKSGHLFPIGPALAPGEALVVFGGGVPTGTFGRAQVQRASAAAGLNLERDGDVLALRDADGQEAARLSWGDCAARRCAEEHWPDKLPADGALVRGSAAASTASTTSTTSATSATWQPHRQVAAAALSPGLRSDGNAW